MNLILWRHAEAEPGTPDPARKLTGRGKRQAARMARWLRKRLPRDAAILVSPARRTRQTADALKLPYTICDDLAQGKTAEQVLAACGAHGGQTVVLVGHQPALGQAASMIITGGSADWTIKKGGAWWITGATETENGPAVLEAAMSPGLLRKK